jgi:outer membrane protein assembly factor BamB
MYTEVDLDCACALMSGWTECADHNFYMLFVGAGNGNSSKDLGYYLDDVTVTYDIAGSSCTAAPDPLEFLTATSTNGQVELEYWTPASAGSCSNIKIVRKQDTCPTGHDDATASVIVDDVVCPGPDQHDSRIDSSAVNGTDYCYAAFTKGDGGTYSTMRTVHGRPQDTDTGPVRWVFNTPATALPPPGLGSVYSAANDRALHGIVAGSSGGTWPASWQPLAMMAPSQSRPVAIQFSAYQDDPPASPAARKVVFLSSQDGKVYAIDGDSGATVWESADYGVLQASPSGIFAHFTGNYDLILQGTRNAGERNKVIALRVQWDAGGTFDGGDEAWVFNSGGSEDVGIISGAGYVDYDTDRFYFTSREYTADAGTLWCLDIADGSQCSGSWPVALGDIDAGPAVSSNGRVYVGTSDGEVWAIDADDGSKLWGGAPYATNDGAVKEFVWAEWSSNKIFVSTSNTVWGLNDDGSSVSRTWQFSVSDEHPAAPLVAGSDVLVGFSDGSLYQLDTTSLSGDPPAPAFDSEQLGGGSAAVGSAGLDVSNNLVYVGTEAGAVYAVSVPLPTP